MQRVGARWVWIVLRLGERGLGGFESVGGVGGRRAGVEWRRVRLGTDEEWGVGSGAEIHGGLESRVRRYGPVGLI